MALRAKKSKGVHKASSKNMLKALRRGGKHPGRKGHGRKASRKGMRKHTRSAAR